MEFQKIKQIYAKEISILIKKTFNEFVANTFTPDACAHFLNAITEELMLSLLKDSRGYVALENSKVVGVILAEQDKNKITALFVDKKYHHKGIATLLVNKIETDFKKQDVTSICCWSSLYAVPFYQAQGFKKTRGVVITKKATHTSP